MLSLRKSSRRWMAIVFLEFVSMSIPASLAYVLFGVIFMKEVHKRPYYGSTAIVVKIRSSCNKVITTITINNCTIFQIPFFLYLASWEIIFYSDSGQMT